jgi:uncharacterized protein with FMN-binding domain
MFLMRRFLLALTGTIAGLAALLSFKSVSSSAGAAAPAPSTPAASSPAASGKTGQSTTAAKTVTKTVKGPVENSPYGPTQVEVSLDGKKIVEVTVLQHTDDGSMSQQIDSNALPQLTKEALTAQSGKIDAVSGASYTSAGYIKSLQSALDEA